MKSGTQRCTVIYEAFHAIVGNAFRSFEWKTANQIDTLLLKDGAMLVTMVDITNLRDRREEPSRTLTWLAKVCGAGGACCSKSFGQTSELSMIGSRMGAKNKLPERSAGD